ncbi:MAG: hypothetical protein ACLFTK_05925 [Anaerolineales bacterium]
MPDRPLHEIGLGNIAQAGLYFISLLPFVGIIIGASYTARRNAATRRLGWRLLTFALVLHGVYTLCICPLLLAWSLSD